MSSLAYHRFRLSVMALAVLNLVVMIVDFSYLAAYVAMTNAAFDVGTLGDIYTLNLAWTDYVLIISTVLIFFAYAYSLKGKRNVNRKFRALSIFVFAVSLIVVAGKFMHDQIQFAKIFIAPGSFLVYKPFTCVGTETTSCNLIMTNIFIALFMGIFSLIEVGWTFSLKPYAAKQEV
ncbi:hypothetical protein FBU30_000165 [Linnemannia zychae]|nr:hypothetical protein FBU30_000165 [Linnemannia zychae]